VSTTRWLGGVAAAVLAAAAVAGPLVAQGAADEPVDRVVAVVGTAAITFTQLQEEFYTRYQLRRQQPPTDSAVVRAEMRALVDTLINAELLYQQALKDTTIVVSSLEISDAVDQTMRQMRQQVQSEQRFLTELRGAGFLGIDDYRRWLIEQQGRELMRERFRDKLKTDGTLVPIAPTEREVRAYYDARRASLPPYPPTTSSLPTHWRGKFAREPTSRWRHGGFPRILPRPRRAAKWTGSDAAGWCGRSKRLLSAWSAGRFPIRWKRCTAITSSRCFGRRPPK
jgi:hypothetical protein